ncbi:MAG: DUF4147 domain-containing protein [Candidatus Binatia bacterium]|nr:DUF4147 domain-containing protein [Candidatus Binatia bacterium]
MGHRADLEAIYRAGVEAVAPGHLIRRHVRRAGGRIEVDLGTRRFRVPVGELWVAGAGKAAAAMAEAIADLAPEARGLVIAPRGRTGARTRRVGRIDILPGSHPVPDRLSFASTEALLRRLRRRPPTDTVLFLLSGGASALLARPTRGVGERDKVRLGRLLLKCGADIGLMNAVRKHVSSVKGGGVLRAAAPRRVLTLALSDVIGDPLPTIGSGPTVADPSTFEEAWRGLAALGVLGDLPVAVRRRLEAGCAGRPDVVETVKPGSADERRSYPCVIGSNRIALNGAAREARRRGYRVENLRAPLRGEAAMAAAAFVAGLGGRGGPTCILAGGETTVSVGKATGRGGRNQEFAVAAMAGLAGGPWSLLSAGTDGIDGQTPAAGGFADGRSRRRAGGAAVVRRVLREHDCGGLLESIGDTLVTGPSGTNVMDFVAALRGPSAK